MLNRPQQVLQQNLSMTKRNKKNNRDIRNYARYSGLAFEMLGIIFLGTFAGVKIDARMSNDIPVFTIILSLFSVVAALYIVLKDLIKK